MQVNSVSLSNISGYQNHKQHAQSNVSPNIAFEGKGDVFEKTKVAKTFKNKIKEMFNSLFQKKELKVREYEPNTDKIAKSVKPQQSSSFALKPVEEIDGSDFSKLEGEIDGQGLKLIKDDNGNVVRMFVPYYNGKILWHVRDYDLNTGKIMKGTYFRGDGKTLAFVDDYDPNTANPVKGTFFKSDGKTLEKVVDYDPNVYGKVIRTTYYKEAGTIDRMKSVKPQQSSSFALKPVEEIDGSDFSKLEGEIDGQGLKLIKDDNGNVVRMFVPYYNGKILWHVRDYDLNTGKIMKGTYFRGDGKTLAFVDDYDPNTANPVKGTFFKSDGKTLEKVVDYDPNVYGKVIRTTYYKEDGTIDK